jgi:hypothetical protein
MGVRETETCRATHVQTELEVAVDSRFRERRVGAIEMPPHPQAAAADRGPEARTQRRLALDANSARPNSNRCAVDAPEGLPDRPVGDRSVGGGRGRQQQRNEDNASPHRRKHAKGPAPMPDGIRTRATTLKGTARGDAPGLPPDAGRVVTPAVLWRSSRTLARSRWGCVSAVLDLNRKGRAAPRSGERHSSGRGPILTRYATSR